MVEGAQSFDLKELGLADRWPRPQPAVRQPLPVISLGLAHLGADQKNPGSRAYCWMISLSIVAVVIAKKLDGGVANECADLEVPY